MEHAPTLVALVLVGVLTYQAFNIVKDLWRQSKPNEWMLVIRDGKLVNCGIGLNSMVWPGDTTVNFRSDINEVSFNSMQVTSEMQGVDVNGILIWSVHREGDGPFRCYKSFGKDIQNQTPAIANEKLRAMAISIVRDRVANMSLDEILKNREKLRSGIKQEIQTLLTGWGMWLETVEILDVKVCSGSLFKQLQTEFREQKKHEAGKILADTNLEMDQEKLKRNTGMIKVTEKAQS